MSAIRSYYARWRTGELLDPAGITLARAFDGSDVSVCLVEAGGREPDADVQAFYRGERNNFV